MKSDVYRQLETTFLTCNVISYVPLALQRPETPGADNNETASATRSESPPTVHAGETRLSAGEEVEITLKARDCAAGHCIDFGSANVPRGMRKPEINPPGGGEVGGGGRVEQVRSLNSAASRGLVFYRVGEREHTTRVRRIKLRFAFARDSGKLETPRFRGGRGGRFLFHALIAWKSAAPV